MCIAHRRENASDALLLPVLRCDLRLTSPQPGTSEHCETTGTG